MYAKVKKTDSGYAFECRKDRKGNIYLLEGYRQVARLGKRGGYFVTALDKDGRLMTPLAMHHGIPMGITLENATTASKNTPLLIPFEKIGLIACIDVTKDCDSNSQAYSVISLYMPTRLSDTDSQLFGSTAMRSAVVYSVKLSPAKVMGIPTVVVSPTFLNERVKYISDFMRTYDILKREDFLLRRLEAAV